METGDYLNSISKRLVKRQETQQTKDKLSEMSVTELDVLLLTVLKHSFITMRSLAGSIRNKEQNHETYATVVMELISDHLHNAPYLFRYKDDEKYGEDYFKEHTIAVIQGYGLLMEALKTHLSESDLADSVKSDMQILYMNFKKHLE